MLFAYSEDPQSSSEVRDFKARADCVLDGVKSLLIIASKELVIHIYRHNDG